MKKNIFKIIGILILVILQLSLFSKFSYFGFTPNLIFILSLILVFRGFFADSLLVAVIGGFTLDLISPFRFGLYTLMLLGILIFINFMVLKNIPSLNPTLIFIITFIIFIIIDLILSLTTRTLPHWHIVIDGAINCLWSMVIYFLVEKFIRQEEINVNI